MLYKGRRPGSFSIMVLIVCLCAVNLQGCALYQAMSGGDDSSDVSIEEDIEDVGISLDSYYDIDDTSYDKQDGGGDESDIEEPIDVENDVEEEKLDCVDKCINNCGGPGADQCNDLVASISLGFLHGCALSGKGEVYCWGNNKNRQLGIDRDDASRPFNRAIKVQGVAGSTSITAAWLHTCAIVYDESSSKQQVWCWGDGEYGQVDGVIDGPKLFVPTLVPFPQSYINGIQSLHAGGTHTCANVIDSSLVGGGAVMCWGANGYQIYTYWTETNTEQFKPLTLTIEKYLRGTLVPTGMVSSKYFHACSIGKVFRPSSGGQYYENALWCWGYADDGQLETEVVQHKIFDVNGEPAVVVDIESRGLVLGVSGEVIVGTGSNHTCFAEGHSSQVTCWGGFFSPDRGASHCTYEELGLLYKQPDMSGNGFIAKDKKEVCNVTFAPEKGGIVTIVAGDNVSCMLFDSGEVECLGADKNGMLARRTLNLNGTLSIKQLDLGSGFACALLEDSSVWCWGENKIRAAEDAIADWTEWSDDKMFEIMFH